MNESPMIKVQLWIPNQWLLLSSAIFIFPVSPYGCILLCGIAALVSFFLYKPKIAPSREYLCIASGFALLSVWMLFRTKQPWGWGWHSFAESITFPVTFLDYIPLFAFFLAIAIRAFPITFAKTVAWAATLTALPQFFILAAGEKYWNWQQGVTLGFPSNTFPLFRIVVSDSLPKLGRMNAGFGNPNVLGTYCGMVLCIAIALLTYEVIHFVRQRDNSRPFRLELGWMILKSLVILSCIGLLGVLILESGSRTAMLIIPVILFAFLVYLLKWFFLKHRSFLLLSVATAAFLNSKQVVALLDSSVLERFNQPVINPHRQSVYTCAVEMIKQRPLQGWGIGTFPLRCEEYLKTSSTLQFFPAEVIGHTHSLPLQLAFDLGIPFALLFVGLVTYLLFQGFKKLETGNLSLETQFLSLGFISVPLSAVFLSLTESPLFQSYRLEFLFWTCLAIAYAGISVKSDEEVVKS